MGKCLINRKAEVDPNLRVERTAFRKWKRGPLTCYLCKHPLWGTALGYVRFPRPPVREPGYRGILIYVPVHGGISYAARSPDGSVVYGFDCAHASDIDFKRLKEWCREGGKRRLPTLRRPRPLKWLRREVDRLAAGILIAAKHEAAYLAAKSEIERGAVLDTLHRYLEAEGFGRFDLTDNALACLRVLSGKL